MSYHELALQLLDQFDEFKLTHVPRIENIEANAMAQETLWLILETGALRKTFAVEKCMLSSFLVKIGWSVVAMTLDVDLADWLYPTIQFLRDSS